MQICAFSRATNHHHKKKKKHTCSKHRAQEAKLTTPPPPPPPRGASPPEASTPARRPFRFGGALEAWPARKWTLQHLDQARRFLQQTSQSDSLAGRPAKKNLVRKSNEKGGVKAMASHEGPFTWDFLAFRSWT